MPPDDRRFIDPPGLDAIPHVDDDVAPHRAPEPPREKTAPEFLAELPGMVLDWIIDKVFGTINLPF